jgi:hypothetical protein
VGAMRAGRQRRLDDSIGMFGEHAGMPGRPAQGVCGDSGGLGF